MTKDEELLARVEIQHLISSYNNFLDQGLVDHIEWIWAEDAVVPPPGGSRIEGRANIMNRFRTLNLRKRAPKKLPMRRRPKLAKRETQATSPVLESALHVIT